MSREGRKLDQWVIFAPILVNGVYWGEITYFIPKCSMYGIFTYIWSKFMVNVGK